MVLGGKKLTIGALIALGLGGAMLYVAGPFVEQPLANPSVVPAPLTESPVIAEPEGQDRKERDAELEKAVCVFEDSFYDYLRAEEKSHQGQKIVWKHYISASKGRSAEEKRRDADIWKKYLELWKSRKKLDVPMLVRANIYRFFFDMPSLGATKEDLSLIVDTDDWEEVSFNYIAEMITPSWYVRYSGKVLNIKECRQDEKFREELPKRFLPFYDNPNDKQTYGDVPNRGILQLVGYRKTRVESFGCETIKALQKHMGDLKGKDFADLGAGSGFTLPLFRECIGPKAKLYACELDKYTLDVLNFTGSKYAIVQQCLSDDCCLPENSVDIINMTGVHMGDFVGAQSQDDIDQHIRPWFRTMARALRPGGMLIINDGNWDLIDRGAQELVESAGFETLELIKAEDHSTFTFVFKVKK